MLYYKSWKKMEWDIHFQTQQTWNSPLFRAKLEQVEEND